MNEQTARQEHHSWEDLSPEEVLAKLVYELYNPVSMLGTQFDRLISEEELLTEDEYDAIFEQMQTAIRQLSRTVVSLKRYVSGTAPLSIDEAPPDPAREEPS